MKKLYNIHLLSIQIDKISIKIHQKTQIQYKNKINYLLQSKQNINYYNQKKQQIMKQMTTEQLPTKRKSRSVSSFLKKTYQILQDSQNSYAVRWSQTGVGFVVVKQEQFSKQILPRYFKHSNYSSFVRQLNMYNFHKIREANYQSHFHHQCFRRNNKLLLAQIKRKPQKKKRKNQQYSEEQNQCNLDNYNDKSDISMKNRIKNNSISSIAKGESSQLKIKSYKSTGDKKGFQNTCHVFGSQKQNQQEQLCSNYSPNAVQIPRVQLTESKQRVSIQNILSGSIQNDEDKLSINNQLAEVFPRYPTKQIFYPSNNNIYPFPINFKGGNVISHFSIFF